MPTFSPAAFNAEQYTATAYIAAKEVVDQLDYTKPWLADAESIHGKGAPKEEGGMRINIALGFGEHSETTQLSTGYEPLNLDISEVGTPGEDDWCDAIRPVVISGHDQRINRGSHKILDIVKERTKATMAAFRRQFHQRIFGIENVGLTDLNTLNGCDHSDGFIERAAVGSQTNTVHTVNKTTYQSSLGWQNQRADGAGSFSTVGLTGLDAIGIQCMVRRSVGYKVGRWYASTSAFANLKRDVRSYERYVNAQTLDTGKLELPYNGYGVQPCRDMPNAGTDTTAQPWSFLFVDHEMIHLLTNGPDYFRKGEFTVQSGYDVTAANIHLMCQLLAYYLGSSGLLYNADAWS